MNIKNTNITLKEGAYILEYCPSGNSYGERITIITYNVKETAKKYKKAGFYLFGCPLLYSENVFFKLTKSFKISTQNHKKITISNAMYHIQKAADNFKIQTD
jgi:hypothetical protein